jgi:hypothetical protein
MTDSVPAAEQPENFTADFTIKITGLRTATINGIENAVRQVEWTLSGSEASQTFELPQTTQVPDPQAEGFVPLQNLTEAQVIAWIETHEPRLPSIKAHIQSVLDREVARAALQVTPMPWAPVAEVPAAPTAPAA